MVTMGNIWDRTTEFLGERTGAVLPFALVGVLLPAIVNGVLGVFQQVPGTITPGWALLGLVASLLQPWGILAITALVIDPARGSADAGRLALRRYLPAVGVYLVPVLAALVLLLPVLLPMMVLLLSVYFGVDVFALLGVRLDSFVQLATRWSTGMSVYVFAVIAAMLVVFIRLAPLFGVIVAERRGIGALAAAWRLTRGLTWRLIGVVLLSLVVAAIAGGALQLVFGSILRLALGGEGPVTAADIITAVLGAVVSAVFTVILSVFCAQLYFATRARADGDAGGEARS